MNEKFLELIMVTILGVKIRIIRKLVRWKKWGAAHTENILNGLPTHLRGEKVTKEALRELIKDQWILPLLKTYEIHYSLNPEKAEDILTFYEEHCTEESESL